MARASTRPRSVASSNPCSRRARAGSDLAFRYAATSSRRTEAASLRRSTPTTAWSCASRCRKLLSDPWTRPSSIGGRYQSGAACDRVPLHERLKSRSLHSEPRGGAPGTADSPVHLLEDPHDVGPLDQLERRRAVVLGKRGRPAGERFGTGA